MEVHAIDTLSGREETLEIDADATVSAMMWQCGEAFGFGEDVELSVDGQRVACEEAERISNVAAFSDGCRVEVVRGVAEFVAQLGSGDVNMDDIPVWARQRRECVLAMLAYALHKRVVQRELRQRSPPVLPHWVHPSLHDDKEVMLQFVKYNPKAFVRASAALRSDAEVVIETLRRDASMWHHVEDKGLQEQRSVALLAVPYCANTAWLSDKAFVLEALEERELLIETLRDCEVWPYVSNALKQDKEVAMKALLGNKVGFGALSETLRGDKDFVMKALRQGKGNFCHLCEALKQDKEVVMEALASDKLGGFHQLGATLQHDREVAMEALLQRNVNFSDLSEALREDKEFVIEALARGGVTNFHQLSATLREDKGVVVEALRSSLALDFSDLCAARKQDKEVVMEALAWDKLLDFHQLSVTLQEDKEVVMEALRRKKVKFGTLSEALRGDKEFVQKALASNVRLSISDTSGALQNDKEIRLAGELQKRLLESVEFESRCTGKVDFCDLSEELRGNRSFVTSFLSSFRSSDTMVNIGDLSEELQGDKEFIMEALDCFGVTGFHQLSATLQQDEEVVMKALGNDVMTFGQVCEAMRGDKEFVMVALYSAQHGDFHKLSATLQQDKEVVMKALEIHFGSVGSFHQLSATLQDDKEVAMKALASSFFCEDEDAMNEMDICDLREAMRGDKEVVMEALGWYKLPDFHQLSATLQQDREVVMEALCQGCVHFENLSEAVQADKAFVIEAIRSGLSYNYDSLTGPLRQDKDVALEVIECFPKLFVTMVPALRDNLDVALAAIRADPCNFIYAGDSVRADKQAALAAFCQADECDDEPPPNPPVLLPFASAELQADREVVLAAICANEKNGVYASPALQGLAASGL